MSSPAPPAVNPDASRSRALVSPGTTMRRRSRRASQSRAGPGRQPWKRSRNRRGMAATEPRPGPSPTRRGRGYRSGPWGGRDRRHGVILLCRWAGSGLGDVRSVSPPRPLAPVSGDLPPTPDPHLRTRAQRSDRNGATVPDTGAAGRAGARPAPPGCAHRRAGLTWIRYKGPPRSTARGPSEPSNRGLSRSWTLSSASSRGIPSKAASTVGEANCAFGDLPCRVDRELRRQAPVEGGLHPQDLLELLHRRKGRILGPQGPALILVVPVLCAVEHPQVVLVAPVGDGVRQARRVVVGHTDRLHQGREELGIRLIEVDPGLLVEDGDGHRLALKRQTRGAPLGIQGLSASDPRSPRRVLSSFAGSRKLSMV
jgi:hypothetical protein